MELQISMEAKKYNVQAIILNNILNIKLTSVSPVVHLSKPQPHKSIFIPTRWINPTML